MSGRLSAVGSVGLSGWNASKATHHGKQGIFYWERGALVMKQDPYGQGGTPLGGKVSHQTWYMPIIFFHGAVCPGSGYDGGLRRVLEAKKSIFA